MFVLEGFGNIQHFKHKSRLGPFYFKCLMTPFEDEWDMVYWRERGGDWGKREESISSVADHYTYHACVMTLITPLNCHLPPLTHKLSNKHSAQWQTGGHKGHCAKILPWKMIPSAFSLNSHLPPHFLFSNPMHGRAGYLIITPPFPSP